MFEDLQWLADGERYSAPQSALARQRRTDIRQSAQAHVTETGVWDGIKAVNTLGVTGAGKRFVEELQFTPDPEWKLPEEASKRWRQQGIATEQWELLTKAHSQEHLEYLEHVALENQQDARTLSAFGFWGILGLALTDIGALPIDIASGGLGYAAKGGRVVNMLRGGAVAAAAGGAVSVVSGLFNPEVTLKDHVTAAALTFALGGALSARRGHLYVDNIHPAAVKRAAGIGEPGTLSAMRDPNAAPIINKTPGLARLRREPVWFHDFSGRADDNWEIVPHFARARRDLAARMGTAKSPLAREAGRLLFRDGVGYTDRDIAVQESTGEFAKRHLATLETQWRRGYNAAWEAHAKAKRLRWYDVSARKAFSEEVGRAVRGATDVSPEALKAAESVRQSLRDAAKLADASGLDGFAFESAQTRATLKEVHEATRKAADDATLQQLQAALKAAEADSAEQLKRAEKAKQRANTLWHDAKAHRKTADADTLERRVARLEKTYTTANNKRKLAYKSLKAAKAEAAARDAKQVHGIVKADNRITATLDRQQALIKKELNAENAFTQAGERLLAAWDKGNEAGIQKAQDALVRARHRLYATYSELETYRPVPEKTKEAVKARQDVRSFTKQLAQQAFARRANSYTQLVEDTLVKQDKLHQAQHALRLTRKADEAVEQAHAAVAAHAAADKAHMDAQNAYSSFVEGLAKPRMDDVASLNPDNYLPRYWSAEGFQRLFGTHRLQEDVVVQGLLRPALRKAWEARSGALDIDDDVLDAVGKAWIKRAQANFEGDGMSLLVRPLDADSVDELAAMLKEAGVDEVRARALLDKFTQRAEEDGKLARAKHRIDLDETFTTTLRNPYGEDIQVSVSDLLENDVDAVMNRYLREITGWSALSSKANIKNPAQLDRFKQEVLRDAFHAGDKKQDLEPLLNIGINATFGKSTEANPGSNYARKGRFLRNWNFSRVMNQVGFTMLAELGSVIAHSGLRNTIRAIPEIRAMLKRGRDGTLASKDAQVMEQLFAPGTDLIRNPPFLRLDEDGAMYRPTFDFKGGHHVDNAMNAANHVTSIASGMAPMTAILQRVAGRGTLLRMMEMAKAKSPKQADIDRLRTWGLDEEAQQQVFDYLKTVSRIEDIDPNALPFETRERLSAFMYRTTRHQVLEGDASDSIEAMHSTTGRILLQFRTFMVNSYTRHFLNSLHHYNDWRTYQMLMLSTAFAGMGWSARAYLNTIGKPEQRERLLTPENFIKNGIAQSSWAHFIPAAADFMAETVLHKDAVFQGNRSTGLQNSILGIPSVDLAIKATNSTGMIGSWLDADEHVTEQQMQDFARIWWFSNMTAWRNIVEAGIDAGFPDRPDGTDRE